MIGKLKKTGMFLTSKSLRECGHVCVEDDPFCPSCQQASEANILLVKNKADIINYNKNHVQ
jgi:hypothetical protein